MSSLAASMQLVQANEMFLKVYPYRIAKVCGLLAVLSKGCSTSVDTKNVLVLRVGGNGRCGTLHLEQLRENRLPNPCSVPLLRDLAFREELMPRVWVPSAVFLSHPRESRQGIQQKVC